MGLKEYLNTNFSELMLKPSLCHQWNIVLHFEFGGGMYQYKKNGTLNLDMFNYVYNQGLAIFNALFSDQDDIFLVVNTYHRKGIKNKTISPKVYRHFIKKKHLKYKIRQRTLPFVFEDEEDAEEKYTTQFYLKCKKEDLQYSSIIKGACNEDFPLKPKFGWEQYCYYPDVFFVNITKSIIFFIFDDRGCEVIATKKESLAPLYKRYNQWIGEYDRKRIDKIFT